MTNRNLFTQPIDWPENGAQFIITVYHPTARERNALMDLLDDYNIDRDGNNFEVSIDVGGQAIALMSRPFEEMPQENAQSFMRDVYTTLVDSEAMISLGSTRYQSSEEWPVVYALTLTN